jgi:hypothetical protein
VQTLGFEQGVLKVEKEREFGELKSSIEKAFVPDRVVKYLKVLASRGIRVRDLDAAFTAGAFDRANGDASGTARNLYSSLPVSDQSQIREFYLSKLEEVDTSVREKFQKLYQYY